GHNEACLDHRNSPAMVRNIHSTIFMDIELVCRMDVGKPPLCSVDFIKPFETKDLEFISLKSSLVLWMLDKRLPFLDYRRGIPGIIYLILSKAKEDIEQNVRPGFLHTEQFLEQCKERSMVTVKYHMHRENGKLVAHAPSYLNEDDPREYPSQWGMDPDSDSGDLSEWQISEWVEEEKASMARDSWEWIK
ncbi:7234_t:CDS:2, partial [Acaulospora colombiana]